MDTEEVLVKVGVNTDDLQRGIQHGNNAITKWLHDNELGFVHAESAGKTFKKLLHEISDVSPLLGAAIRSVLAPEVVVMQALTKMFADYDKQQEEAIKKSEEHAKREAKRYMETFEAASKATEAVRKGREEQEKFESQLGRGKPAETEKERHGELVESARRASATDAEFLAKKKIIDATEEGNVAAMESMALAQEQGAAARTNDEARIRSIEDLKNKIKNLKELQEEGAEKGFGGGKLKNEWLGVLSKEEHNAITQAIGTDRANLFAKLRQQAEQELSDKESALAKDKETLNESKQNVTELNKLRKDVGHAVKEDEKKLFDAERKEKEDAVKKEIADSQAVHEHNKVAFLTEKIAIETNAKAEAEAAGDKKAALEYEKQLRTDNLALASAQKDQSLAQAHLDREVAQTRRHRAEAERSPYMPTLEELANSIPWQRDFTDEARRRSDAMTMRMGMAFGQRHAGEAQELERLKDEAKRALFVEGPDSMRFKEDLKRIDSLKKGLAAAGLQTSDDKLESIDKHMADLIDRASKEGLVVQPVNAP